MIEEFNDLPLPKSLYKWTKYNLVETYSYTSNKKLKNMLSGEIWYRNEMDSLWKLLSK